MFWFFFSLGSSPFSATILPTFQYCCALFIVPEIQHLPCWADYSQFQLPTNFLSSLPCSLPQEADLSALHHPSSILRHRDPCWPETTSPRIMTVLGGCLGAAQGGRGLRWKAEANPEGTHSGRLPASRARHGRWILCGGLRGAPLWLPQDTNRWDVFNRKAFCLNRTCNLQISNINIT